MTAASIASPAIPYFSNLARASDNLIGAILSIKPSEFVGCFLEARAMSIAAGEEGRCISVSQTQEVRKMAALQAGKK